VARYAVAYRAQAGEFAGRTQGGLSTPGPVQGLRPQAGSNVERGWFNRTPRPNSNDVDWHIPKFDFLADAVSERAFQRAVRMLPWQLRGLYTFYSWASAMRPGDRVPVWNFTGFEHCCGPRPGWIPEGTNPVSGIPTCVGLGAITTNSSWFDLLGGYLVWGWHPSFGPTVKAQIEGWKAIIELPQPLKYVNLQELPAIRPLPYRFIPNRLPYIELDPSYWTTRGYAEDIRPAGPVGRAGPTFALTYGGVVEQAPGPQSILPSKPPRMEAEKKFQLRSSSKLAVRALGHATEVIDFVEALWDAIPYKDPVTGKSNHKTSPKNWVKIGGQWQQVTRRNDRGVPYTHPSLSAMLGDIAKNLNKVDPKEALKNVVWNEVKDRAIAKAQKTANAPFLKAQAKYGSKRPVGTGFGPLL
jgi:hypothetical protein